MKIGESKRQGDVLVVRKAKGTAKGTVVPRDKGRVVLAYGEVTGHAHALAEPEVEQLLDEYGNQQLVVGKVAPLVHEEHAPHTLEPGDHDVVRQYEFDPVAERRVAD